MSTRLTKLLPGPVQKDVDITYHTETFNGSFLNLTPWRGKAGPETDEAWDSLGIDCESPSHPSRAKSFD